MPLKTLLGTPGPFFKFGAFAGSEMELHDAVEITIEVALDLTMTFRKLSFEQHYCSGTEER